MQPSHLTIPLSLPLNWQDGKGGSAVEAALSLCAPTCLVHWGKPPADDGGNMSPHCISSGVSLGCGDGSVFLFHGQSTSDDDERTLPPKVIRRNSRHSNSSRYLASGRGTPRSISPSSAKMNFTPFQVSRSRIVSSVTSEQAEAPKNYVDFDEEAEKLKRMLKGKSTKERTPDEPRSPREGDETAEQGTRSPSQSSSAVPNVNSFSKDKLTSSPPSPPVHKDVPKGEDSCRVLSLKCHIIPSRAGFSTAVTALKLFGQHNYMACLQRAGYISIHSTADGLCLGSIMLDDGDAPQPAGQETRTRLPVMWDWCSLQVVACEESNIIIACASREDSYRSNITDDQDPSQQTRIAVFDVSGTPEQDPTSLTIAKIGEELLDGLPECIALCRASQGIPQMLRIASNRHVIIQSFNRTSALAQEKSPSESTSSKSLLLPNPFKALASLSTERLAEENDDMTSDMALLNDEVDLGELPLENPVLGLRVHDTGDAIRVLAWSSMEILVFDIGSSGMQVLSVRHVSGTQKAEWVTCDSFTVVDSVTSTTYGFQGTRTNVDNPGISAEKGYSSDIRLLHSHPLASYDALCLNNTGDITYTYLKAGSRQIDHVAAGAGGKVKQLWKSRHLSSSTGEGAYPSSVLPIEPDRVVIGFSDGRLGHSSLPALVAKAAQDATSALSDISLDGSIATISAVNSERTDEKFLVGGADDGSIAIWAFDSLKLHARWVVFTEPLVEVIHLQGEAAGRMKGCLFCVSQDGTVAVITLDGFQFLYILPASMAALQRISIGGDNLLLIYADHRARLWDTRTREFWRSMNIEKAEEMLQQGGWTEWNVGTSERSPNTVLSVTSRGNGIDAASSLLLDMEALLRQSSPTQSSGTLETRAPTRLAYLRAILSSLLTFGLSNDIDQICQERLGANKSDILAGCMSVQTPVLYADRDSSSAWTTSPEISALRSVALLSVLQVIGQHENLFEDAETVTGFYAASLGETLGPSYMPPSLPLLAKTWLLSSAAELRHAARTSFDVGVVRLSDDGTMALADLWQNQLPSRQPEDAQSLRSAMALFICGFVAVEKYTLLPSSALTDVAKSIALYLHDETSPWRALGIDLCSRGFAIWQQHVDAVEMLRALFTLATTTRKDSISPHNIGSQARTAVLQIATNNSALFMTTLTIDILHPRSLNHRKSILQLVIFLIRKKPLTLYSNLPRLVEAVVKSLDPNSTASRDAVLDSATEILGHIVRTYPTVDFHMATQRLAVGTSEGAVVMYDLKTATRLYVLEGHRKRTAACSFSPDGRRLVTLSLEESLLLVWKVGSSFSSFFNPGAPPRQGQSGSDPFKTLSFNIGNEAHMTLANTLELVHFEWPADRSVKVKIRQSTLTFST
ncbi:hypothetical protein CERSUDRAFT_132102 [Gelatoporia subvermispora B]|uniref:Uncharacterized protein n=1 Tax=Ceriporiopsis subvermispora (strain B) TaxID=914234 RepID=M2PSI3_CERS8|nr:hypothetical protein CERSUDRAFT_132102 [Gelatoporia subvermispora B]